jgi:hypothetical protein
MLGHKSRAAKLLQGEFSSVTIWYCANHRLELSVTDTVTAAAEMNRFRACKDKLYVFYPAPMKNSRELHECAKLLEIQLLIIGRILSS